MAARTSSSMVAMSIFAVGRRLIARSAMSRAIASSSTFAGNPSSCSSVLCRSISDCRGRSSLLPDSASVRGMRMDQSPAFQSPPSCRTAVPTATSWHPWASRSSSSASEQTSFPVAVRLPSSTIIRCATGVPIRSDSVPSIRPCWVRSNAITRSRDLSMVSGTPWRPLRPASARSSSRTSPASSIACATCDMPVRLSPVRRPNSALDNRCPEDSRWNIVLICDLRTLAGVKVNNPSIYPRFLCRWADYRTVGSFYAVRAVRACVGMFVYQPCDRCVSRSAERCKECAWESSA